MKKSALLLNILIIAILFLTVSVKGVMAGPHLLVDPSVASYTNGTTFDVKVKVDSGTQIIGGADVVGTYDSNMLTLVSVTKSPSLVFGSGECIISNSDVGKFTAYCYAGSNVEDKAVNGELVVLKFTAKASGTATVKFTCVNLGDDDCNIAKSTPPISDLIVCSENVNGSYAITGGATAPPTTVTSTTITTTPTSTPTPTVIQPTQTPSTQLPQSGAVEVTIGLVVFGAISLISALFLKFL